MNNANDINNIFEQSKQYVINALLESPKDYIVDIGNGLKSSQISYNNDIVNIIPLNDNDRKILINGIKALNAGFIKTLRENNIEVQKLIYNKSKRAITLMSLIISVIALFIL
ncbi:hypothetical protein [Clostridium botulinum]|uniref:DNA polymerase III, subunits gamma and tau n=1 Tax=Clostridium botulinum TaxID=1491 RepID=A0A1L7JNP5_CLOBO|nr:hypothetical protein [Clostridium botulinum]APU87113.1 DNA polymerase III, subunits gamma and tau [Clostridium botulinum]